MYGQPPGYTYYNPSSPSSPDGAYSGQYGSPQPQAPKQQVYSTGYTPASYDAPGYGGGVQPEQFYGQLIDPASGRPSEILTRMADSLFFYMDAQCDVVGLRNTGHVEPRKYCWLMARLGAPADSIQAVELSLQDFYTNAQVPFKLVNVQGETQPVLDRRGFLHMVTFEARAEPNESHSHWTKSIAMFSLVDPATRQPLPSPVPRSAWPTLADNILNSAYMSWRIRAVSAASRARTNAMVAQITGGFGTRPYGSAFGGAGGANPYLSGSAQTGANPYLAAMQASQAQSAATTNQILQDMQAQKRRQSYVSAATNVITTLMGGGTGFTGFGS